MFVKFWNVRSREEDTATAGENGDGIRAIRDRAGGQAPVNTRAASQAQPPIMSRERTRALSASLRPHSSQKAPGHECYTQRSGVHRYNLPIQCQSMTSRVHAGRRRERAPPPIAIHPQFPANLDTRGHNMRRGSDISAADAARSAATHFCARRRRR